MVALVAAIATRSTLPDQVTKAQSTKVKECTYLYRLIEIIALREIRQYQKLTGLLVPWAPVVCLIHQIMQDVSSVGELRITPDAISVLHDAMEAHLAMQYQFRFISFL